MFRPRIVAAMAALLLLAGSLPASASDPVDASIDALGHSDLKLWDHFLIVEDHWIELHGTATIASSCGERALDYHLSVRGRENFYAGLYEYSVDFPEGEIELTDGGELVLRADIAGARLRLRYPRPSGSPTWSLLGDWTATSRQVLLPDCSWSGESTDPLGGEFWLHPVEHEADEVGVVISATGILYGALDVPVSSDAKSFGTVKASYCEPR